MRFTKSLNLVVVLVLGALVLHAGCDGGNETNPEPSTQPDGGIQQDTDTQPDGGIQQDTDTQQDDGTDSGLDTGSVVGSHIWIANSQQGTVSKIDTRTLAELGRYWVRPDHAGDPSRTSVSLHDDVVVASRSGGVTKIYGDTKRCMDSNGQPGIQTSTGASDILDWDLEECRAWHTPFNYTSMRAIAWTSTNKVWVTGSTGPWESSAWEVVLLNGNTGEVETTIVLDTKEVTAGSFGHGGYGGVVDSDNNFWIVQLGKQKLVRVSYDDLTYEVFEQPLGVYGVAIDKKGRIWACNTSVAYFDPIQRKWSTPVLISNKAPYFGQAGGCTTDGKGLLWVSVYDKLYALSIEDLAIVDTISNLPGRNFTGADSFWGMAMDVDGYLWTIPRKGKEAYRIDPKTHQYETVTGLVGAYTYSDMTGFLLGIVHPT